MSHQSPNELFHGLRSSLPGMSSAASSKTSYIPSASFGSLSPRRRSRSFPSRGATMRSIDPAWGRRHRLSHGSSSTKPRPLRRTRDFIQDGRRPRGLDDVEPTLAEPTPTWPRRAQCRRHEACGTQQHGHEREDGPRPTAAGSLRAPEPTTAPLIRAQQNDIVAPAHQ